MKLNSIFNKKISETGVFHLLANKQTNKTLTESNRLAVI